MNVFRLFASISCLAIAGASLPADEDAIRVGFAHADITPDIEDDHPVWLAGYGAGRRATGIHDPIFARSLVVADERSRVAIVSVDLVGLQYEAVQQIREKLKDYLYVLVCSTHSHEGPDVIGIWGRTHVESGVDPAYIDLVVERAVESVRKAERRLQAATAWFGTAKDESLVSDSRRPFVFDGVLRVLRFEGENKKRLGLLVQWNSHPEALGSRNTQITADFPYQTIADLKREYECPIVYVSGALGGLMAPPDDGRITDGAGRPLDDGTYLFAERYGSAVAALAVKAVAGATPIKLAPLRVNSQTIAVPVDNPYYRAAYFAGALPRKAWVYESKEQRLGREFTATDVITRMAIKSETACLRLGELRVACIPGEIYPELVYGKFEDPAAEGADYPEAPLEPSVREIMPDERWMLIGLANDEIGYIIPRRQWDFKAPYAYGRSERQYGEINSCSPEVAPLLMKALKSCVERVK